MIEVKSIICGYGKKTVLSELSLNVKRGELLSVIGLNGCGKSTLLKALSGIVGYRSGKIFIDGISTKDLSPRSLARKVAYLPQINKPSDMTVGEFALMGRFPHTRFPHVYSNKDKLIVKDTLEKLNVSSVADAPLSSLSGGMLQRAYIAMALCQEADCILLDEPSTHLDISADIDLVRIMRRLTEDGKAVVLVTHDIPLAFDVSDRVAVLSDGRISADGAPHALLSDGVVGSVFGVKLLQTESGGHYFDRKNEYV